MKNALIGILLIIIALMATTARDHSGAQAMIEDTSAHHAGWYDCRLNNSGPVVSRRPNYHPHGRKADNA